MRHHRHHVVLQVSQMKGQALAELVKKGQVEGDATQGIKHTEHLPRECGGGQVSIPLWEI